MAVVCNVAAVFQGNMKGNPSAFLELTQHVVHLGPTNAR